ncbi:putative acetyltransferase (GNAT) domain containing protein [Lyophyllum shimeji]|uniref:Acetyltransferase (GNAT) domain containing protein n=1 Tax=Lyophyllum shimeji TaxID=47721 RepID=A0A9P3PXF1_LYOSH|nr:putative acetyltransferase (GNAT) domain containing protein [Lyophyllum shimeji]
MASPGFSNPYFPSDVVPVSVIAKLPPCISFRYTKVANIGATQAERQVLDSVEGTGRCILTGEPFLRLPAPRSQIIITPPRESDVDAVVCALNAPEIYHWMSGPPYPYLREHGGAWLTEQLTETDAILEDLQKGDVEPLLKTSLGCPLRMIRELHEDGTDTYLGWMGIYRSERQEILDVNEREEVLAQDALRKAGDPRIVWDLAYYIVPARHGQGIMSAALSAVIDQWAIPRLNAHIIQASTLDGNVPSIRVLEKVGFRQRGGVCNHEEVRGELRGVQWLEWNRTRILQGAQESTGRAGEHEITQNEMYMHCLYIRAFPASVYIVYST